MTNISKLTKDLVFSAICLAIAMVLPFITGQIPQIGNMLLPMHFPILLCGFICGWKYGGIVGFIAPILRFFLFGMPPLMPVGVSMAFEMAVYAVVIGLIYKMLPKMIKGLPRITNIYISLIVAMVSGRVVWGIIRVLLTLNTENVFNFTMFISGALINAVPGIIAQLILVPVLVYALEKSRIMQ